MGIFNSAKRKTTEERIADWFANTPLDGRVSSGREVALADDDIRPPQISRHTLPAVYGAQLNFAEITKILGRAPYLRDGEKASFSSSTSRTKNGITETLSIDAKFEEKTQTLIIQRRILD